MASHHSGNNLNVDVDLSISMPCEEFCLFPKDLKLDINLKLNSFNIEKSAAFRFPQYVGKSTCRVVFAGPS